MLLGRRGFASAALKQTLGPRHELDRDVLDIWVSHGRNNISQVLPLFPAYEGCSALSVTRIRT
jgi:hypothetical protein